jgi:hypothetical protein
MTYVCSIQLSASAADGETLICNRQSHSIKLGVEFQPIWISRPDITFAGAVRQIQLSLKPFKPITSISN